MGIFWRIFIIKRSKATVRLFLLFVILLVSACGGGGGGGNDSSVASAPPPSPTINIVAADSTTSLSLPPQGALTAEINAACLNGSQSTSLADNGFSSFTANFTTDVVTGNCTFNIVFTFDDPDFGAVAVATASIVRVINNGANNINVMAADYVYGDDDGDGKSNLEELDINARTNPETPPRWGEFFWNEERWTL